MGVKNQNATPPTNDSQKFSKFSRIFLIWSSQNHFEDFEILSYRFLTIFLLFLMFCFRKFQIYHFWRNKNLSYLESKRLQSKRSKIWELVGTYSSSTYVGYLWPCSAQGYLGAFGALAIFTSLLFTKATTFSTNHSTAEIYQTSPEFSCQWASQKYVWDF